ncbi:MAG TPA: response regulator [Bacteroidales bacterium]|jgi:Response regulator containing a CheY-like receiver domain and an HTH DNA-binding domain
MKELSALNILVIDDSFVNRQYIKAVLEEEGINVVEAGDGTEALDILKTYTPDLVILDLLMPVMGGIETLQEIRNRKYDFPILILTADINDSTRQTCLQLGASGFINKPTNGKDILKLIKKVFQNQ